MCPMVAPIDQPVHEQSIAGIGQYHACTKTCCHDHNRKETTDMEMARQLANVAAAQYNHKPGLIAKIERAEAIPRLEEILLAS